MGIFSWIGKHKKLKKIAIATAFLGTIMSSVAQAKLPPKVEANLVPALRQAEVAADQGKLEIKEALYVAHLLESVGLRLESEKLRELVGYWPGYDQSLTLVNHVYQQEIQFGKFGTAASKAGGFDRVNRSMQKLYRHLCDADIYLSEIEKTIGKEAKEERANIKHFIETIEMTIEGMINRGNCTKKQQKALINWIKLFKKLG